MEKAIWMEPAALPWAPSSGISKEQMHAEGCSVKEDLAGLANELDSSVVKETLRNDFRFLG